MPNDKIAGYVQDQLDRQAERAKWMSKWLFRLIPASLFLGLVTALVIWQFWGFKELMHDLLKVLLTLTLGASLFAGFIRRLEKVAD